jgi:hypothetical protein
MSINGTLLHTPGVVGVWNVSQYPCQDFRSEVVRTFFVLWPEMLNGVFKYCCEDGASNYRLANFTYGLHQGQLDPRPYFDLGVVETFLPYWYFWTFWQVPTKNISFPLHCDYTDMHHLYVSRFWNKIIVLGAKTGAVLLGILELAVIVCVVCMWLRPFLGLRPLIGNRPRCVILKNWFLIMDYEDVITEWAHLILLALIGGCMMEAIGHSSLHVWRASVMYNAGALYSYLTAMAILSSLLRQLAMFYLPRRVAKDLPEKGLPGKAWIKLRKIGDDWRWQKVFAQLGVLILMGTYLALVDTDDGGAMDSVAGIVLAAVVAACIWSAGAAVLVFIRSGMFMIRVYRSS